MENRRKMDETVLTRISKLRKRQRAISAKVDKIITDYRGTLRSRPFEERLSQTCDWISVCLNIPINLEILVGEESQDLPLTLELSVGHGVISEFFTWKDFETLKESLEALYPEYEITKTSEENEGWREPAVYELKLWSRPEEIKGDLLDQKGFLFQQCNCVTVKAHGLSQSFIKRFGKRADIYGKRAHRSANTATLPDTPGTYKILNLRGNTAMVAVFGQWLPGKPRACAHMYSRYRVIHNDTYEDRFRYFEEALNKFVESVDDDRPAYFPYRIGCGLAGGNWDNYRLAIERFAARYRGPVYIVRQ